MLICKFCSKECKNENSLRNHERLCKENPNKQKSSLSEYHKSGESKGKPAWNSGLPAWNRGLPGTFLGKSHSSATKEKMSNSKKELYASGWEPVCGRSKKYKHISPIAGEILVDGTWELKVAQHLDSLGVKWNRNRIRFNYTRPDGKAATYQPDFYVHDWSSFLEVKGYETELDRCKWSQFSEPLIIWRKKEIKDL
jgi:hypothetical protein